MPKHHKGKKSNRERLGFLAQFPGACATCKVEYEAGTFIKYNVNGAIVHGRGCPKKTSKVSPLAG